MIYCRKCGFEIPDDSLFCLSCGTPVVKTKKSEKESTPVKSEDKNYGGTILNTKQTYGIIDLERLPEDYEIDNRYKVIKKLGQGSFGAVYKVYDRELEIEKALKIIPEAISNDKEAMNNLRKEASIMAKLNHTNIVHVYDFHYKGDIKYIDMEYVEGESLADIKLKKPDKKFSEEEVKEYAIQILEGLSYAHKKKVIHKDIKPQNIMLDESGMIRIMDFGIAESVHSSMSRLKNTGSSGTLVYMSPEQLRGEDVGKEADIYSLGATLYELLSGHPPFYQGDITYQIINEKPVELKDIPEYLNSIIQKCLEKDKTKRFTDCDLFRKALLNKEKAEDEIKVKDLQKAKIKTIKNEQKEAGTFTDQRDGQTYKWVKIGEQIWMAENLNYKTEYGSWCYGDKESNCNTYGRLYNWETAKKVYPDGWHLPTDEEWKELERYLGMSVKESEKKYFRGTDEGSKLKETGLIHWKAPHEGSTNESGFSALPGGYRDYNGNFHGIGYRGYWWSSSEYSSTTAWYRTLNYDRSNVLRDNDYEEYGFSVHYVRDY